MLAAAGGLLVALLVPSASADTTRLLGDWTASCWTDQQRCAAETDPFGRSERGAVRLTLSIARRDGAETGWEVGFRLRQGTPAPDAVLTLATDEGAAFRFEPGDYALTQSDRFVRFAAAEQVAGLLAALREGRRVRVALASAERGGAEAAFSLRGLAAALAWIDTRQDRVGSSDLIAAVETVEEPETAVETPPQPVEPPADAVKAPAEPAEAPAETVKAPPEPAEAPAETVKAAPKPAEPPALAVAPPREPGMVPERPAPEAEGPGQIAPGEAAKVPAPVLARHLAKSECEPLEGGLLDRRLASAAALSDNKMLYVIPCFAGAYNIAYRLYVVRNNDIATMRTLYFANYSQSLGWYGSDTLINVSYEPETGILRAFGKGRGLGDCGNAAVYRWEDFDFRMIEYRAWDRCDGSRRPERWPVIYRAADAKNPAALLPPGP